MNCPELVPTTTPVDRLQGPPASVRARALPLDRSQSDSDAKAGVKITRRNGYETWHDMSWDLP